MKKTINLVFEKEGWNFNGRMGNTCPNLNAIKKGNHSELMQRWFRIYLDPKSASSEDVASSDPLFGYVKWQAEHKVFTVDNIPDQTYFYPIQLINDTLVMETKQFLINTQVLNDIKNRKAYLLFLYDAEGTLRRIKTHFKKLVVSLNLPKDRVIVIHGDFDIDCFKEEPYTYFPVCIFPWWIFGNKINNLVKPNTDKIFLSYNRTLRSHKIGMLYTLAAHDVVKNGIISCGKITNESVEATLDNYGIFKNKHNISKLLLLSDTSPDNKKFPQDNPADGINLLDFEQSFMSLTIETLDYGMFLSEKSFKPIKVGHPFIILGTLGQLALVKKFGFQTFSKWWREDYDQVSDYGTRMNMIADIIRDLSLKSKEELLTIRREMTPVLLHNQRLFNKIVTAGNVYYANYPIKYILDQILKEEK